VRRYESQKYGEEMSLGGSLFPPAAAPLSPTTVIACGWHRHDVYYTVRVYMTLAQLLTKNLTG
jgi:hypothetical protein